MHEVGHKEDIKLLVGIIALTGGFMAVEVVIAFFTNSLALLADAGHMLADVTGLLLALFAAWLIRRKAPSEKTFGWYRAEALATLGNCIILIGVSLYILLEAYQRIIAPQQIMTTPMIATAFVGLIVNIIGIKILHPHKGEAMYIKTAFTEVLADAVGSVAVIISGVIIMFTGLLIADPIASIGLALFILYRTIHLLRGAIDILLEAAPTHVDVKAVRHALLRLTGVKEVHDIHVWAIATGFTSLTAHIVAPRNDHILRSIQQLLRKQFGIWHCTLQIERPDERCRRVHGRWKKKKR
jgi:cobalt-zinc-cadmium efflux system protein